MKIILDAMGGDNAPNATVMGAVAAAKDFGANITLVGRENEIMQALKDNGMNQLPAGITIFHAEDVVDMHDDPAAVVRKRKDSSMIVGLKMLSQGEGDAFISAGSTGALLTGATLVSSGSRASVVRPWAHVCPIRPAARPCCWTAALTPNAPRISCCSLA